MQVKFYKTSQDSVDQTFVSLCDKLYSANSSFFVFTPSQNYIDELDRYLWTYSSPKFIPHLQANCAEVLMYNNDSQQSLNCLSSQIMHYNKQEVVLVPINAKCDSEEHLHLTASLKNFVNTSEDIDVGNLKTICIIFCDDAAVMEKFQHIADFIEALKVKQITYNIWDNTNALKTWEKIV